MLFIGPNDLASSLGYVAFDHAITLEVQQATERILKATLAAGKYAGHFALDAATGRWNLPQISSEIFGLYLLTRHLAAQRYQQGFHIVNCGADIVTLTSSISAEVQMVKNLTTELAPTEINSGHSGVHNMKTINVTKPNGIPGLKLY